ncbi:uncharacterized protein [Typha angustifolia]|uniref:uncharacterized protein n=1 Tax=Typha angustifolia TaxID=59011 RepID=UPI003C3074FB
MSLLQHPDGVESQSLQVWNNAAFDDAAAGSDGSATKLHWSPLRSVSTNRSDWLDLDPSKENRIPALTKSPVSKKSPFAAVKKPAKVAFKEAARVDDSNIDAEIAEIEKEIERLSSRLDELRTRKAERDSRAAARRGRIVPAKFLDIKQNTAKNLESSASKKMEDFPAPVGLRQRGLSLGPMEISGSRAKLFGQKPSSTKNATPATKRTGESPSNAKLQSRGLSLGPLEIQEGGTPLKPVQNRRKSVIIKLEDIEEEKVPREESERSPKPRPPIAACDSTALRKGSTKSFGPKKVADPRTDVMLRRRGVSLGPSEIANSIRPHQRKKLQDLKDKQLKGEQQRSSSQSPKSRRLSAAKFSDLRKGIATVGAKKPVCKREDGSSSVLRPKALFREEKSTVLTKRPSRSSSKVRVVASRYSLATVSASGEETESKRRKWSLPESFSRKGSSNVSLAGSCGSIPESPPSPMEKGLDTAAQVEEGETVNNVQGKEMNAWQSPPSIMKVAEMLPRIKTLRCTTDSPRDSGCAKRVSELVGRRSIFGVEEVVEEEGISSNQVLLTFEDEE